MASSRDWGEVCDRAVQVARADHDVVEGSESWRLCGASIGADELLEGRGR